MRTEYCPNCGHKNLYEVSKPKFCSKCGQDLSGSVSVTSGSSPTERGNFEIDDPDGEDIFEVPNINRLEYEIEHDQGRRQTLGEISNSAKAESPSKLPRAKQMPSGKKKSPATKIDIIKGTMKDCSSSSNPIDIE